MMRFSQQRPGVSLIELTLFIAIFAICSGVVLSLFYATTEHRVRQQVIMSVEQGGLQLLQTLTHRVRTAERIIDPPAGSTGSFLALQVSDEDVQPTVFTAGSGGLIVVQKDTLQFLNRDLVTVTDFYVENTSIGDSKSSLTMWFTISNVIPLPVPTVFEQTFQATVTVFPDHEYTNHCDCELPACTDGYYEWEVCNSSVCTDSEVSFPC